MEPPATSPICPDPSSSAASADNGAPFLTALTSTTLELLAQQDRAGLLQAMADHAAKLLDAPHAALGLLEDGLLRLRAVHASPQLAPGAFLDSTHAPAAWQAIANSRPVVIADYAQWEFASQFFLRVGVRSAALFPIVSAGGCAGVLALWRTDAARPFSETDVAHGVLLSQLAALVLHNAAIHAATIRQLEERSVQLLENEAKFRAIFDNGPVPAVLATFPEGRIIELNDALVSSFGYTRDAIVGRTTLELGIWVRPEDRESFVAQMQRYGKVEGLEALLRRSDGEANPVLINCRVMTLAGRVCALLTLTDIAGRKQTEETLSRNETRLREAQSIARLGSWELDIAHNRLHWSPMIFELFELDPAVFAATYEAFLDRVHPEDRELVNSTYQRSVRERTVYELEHRLLFPDGRIKYVIERGVTEYAADGSPSISRGTVQDITRRKLAELAVRRKEQQFQNLFEFAPDATIMVDQDGCIVRINRRAEELFGYSRDELVGQSVETLVPEAHRAGHAKRRLDYGHHPGPRAMSERASALFARRRDGSTFPVEISLAPVDAESGTLVAAAIRDVTAQRAAEAQRREAEVRLRQAQKMESLGTLAGGIAHDFNNILTGMLGFAELARMDLPAGHPARPWVANTIEAGARAKSLVRQILTFSRQTEGAVGPVRVPQVVNEAVKLLRSTLPAMVRIDVQLDPNCPPVLADATQLHQIIMNLGTNAWHALPESNGVIDIAVARCEIQPSDAARLPGIAPGAAVRISVCDNGRGMPPEVLDRIFDPFFTTKVTGKGTGLGLAVVDGIVRAHKGAITVRSEVGRGTTFEIFLPALDALSAPPFAADASKLRKGNGERILLVDDDETGREALSLLLAQLGYEVRSFNGPVTALATLLAEPAAFDLVISDLAMPEMSGVELIHRLHVVRPEMPVLLISGYIDPEKSRELCGLSTAEILLKPPSVEELAQAVARCLERAAK